MPRFHSLRLRLTFSFILVAIIGITAVAVLANQATSSGLQQFIIEDESTRWIILADELAASFAARGSWDGADALLRATRPGQSGVALELVSDSEGAIATAGSRSDAPGATETAQQPLVTLPVEVNGRTVASLSVYAATAGAARAGEQFLAYVNRALWIGGGLAVLAALGLGGWLAARLSRPVQRLTSATRQLAAGAGAVRVPVERQDEFGELATSFNQMADALQEADEQRRQLLADVAHELRTPLTIMRGHVEAMLDGVFPFDTDNLALVHEETLLLSRLVEDLRTLSLAESGALPLLRAAFDPAELARKAVAAFAPLAEADGIRLAAEIPAGLPLLNADADRIQQVLGNLLANAVRHVVRGSAAEPAVTLRVALDGAALRFAVADNGPGLSPAEREKVFARFWRGDRSRSRGQGGSGLGLAIAAAIVTAHGGHIWVESDPGAGSTFSFSLPLAGGSAQRREPGG